MPRRRAPPTPPPSLLEEEIVRLRNELYFTRRALIEMTPQGAQDVLLNYYNCKSREDVFRWLNEAIEKIVGLAEAKPARQMGDYGGSGNRAYCPLCHRGSDNPFGINGFAFPGGLERHLEGSYNARQCDVIKAALGMALDHLTDTPKLGPVS